MALTIPAAPASAAVGGTFGSGRAGSDGTVLPSAMATARAPQAPSPGMATRNGAAVNARV